MIYDKLSRYCGYYAVYALKYLFHNQVNELKKYEKDYASACAEIDSKYLSIISNELGKFMDVQTPIVRRMYDSKLAQYKQELDDTLERDIEENNDKEIKRAYEAEIAKRVAPLDAQRKKKHDEIRANLKKLKDKK